MIYQGIFKQSKVWSVKIVVTTPSFVLTHSFLPSVDWTICLFDISGNQFPLKTQAKLWSFLLLWSISDHILAILVHILPRNLYTRAHCVNSVLLLTMTEYLEQQGHFPPNMGLGCCALFLIFQTQRSMPLLCLCHSWNHPALLIPWRVVQVSHKDQVSSSCLKKAFLICSRHPQQHHLNCSF